jgi:hypothetical protein
MGISIIFTVIVALLVLVIFFYIIVKKFFTEGYFEKFMDNRYSIIMAVLSVFVFIIGPIAILSVALQGNQDKSFYLSHQNTDPRVGAVYLWVPEGVDHLSPYQYRGYESCLHGNLLTFNNSDRLLSNVLNASICKS